MGNWNRSFSVNTTFKKSDIDEENGILRNVLILQQGVNKNGSLFDRKFAKKIVELGNGQELGVKSRFGHPGMCSESLGTYVGRYKNFSHKSKKVLADLHLDEICKDAPGQGNLYNYIIQHAKKNPDMFGNSIVVGYDPESFEYRVITNEEGEEEEVEYFDPISLPGSDLVDSPAATDALFSQDNLGVKITSFLEGISVDEQEKLFKSISDNKKVFEFVNRFKNNHMSGVFSKIFGDKNDPKKEETPLKKDVFVFTEENYNSILEENKALKEELKSFKEGLSEEAIFELIRGPLEKGFDGLQDHLNSQITKVNDTLNEFAENTNSQFKDLNKYSKKGEFEEKQPEDKFLTRE